MLNRARNARKLRGPWDRAYTRFWQTVKGDRAWRRLEPGLWDYELAYGPVIDELEPDLIHAHDFRMLGVGARAVIRARASGHSVKLLWDAHEFLPGVQPWQDNARWLPANTAHEREYAPYADAVVTVSDELAELLQREHHLSERPIVVLNAPTTEANLDNLPDDGQAPAATLRDLCGIGEDVPLLVYSGLAAEKRGLATMIEALPGLPGAHVALVVNRPESYYVGKLREQAANLGVSGRVHVLPYVSHWQVVPFLSTADIGVIPIHHWPNHEIALITKFFEYSHARLPIVVSDVRAMSDMVRSTGQGEVFRATDVDDFLRAVRSVLADPERYRAAYDKPGLLAGWTWEAQAEVLDGVYRRLVHGQHVHPPGGSIRVTGSVTPAEPANAARSTGPRASAPDADRGGAGAQHDALPHDLPDLARGADDRLRSDGDHRRERRLHRRQCAGARPVREAAPERARGPPTEYRRPGRARATAAWTSRRGDTCSSSGPTTTSAGRRWNVSCPPRTGGARMWCWARPSGSTAGTWIKPFSPPPRSTLDCSRRRCRGLWPTRSCSGGS